MRIAYITAGAAGSYCGVCARDVALARRLLARGHDVELLPLYTPLRADGPDPSVDEVFYGGINVYLQQRWAFFRRTPRLLDWALDRPALLRLASRFAVSTRPEELGDLTVSVLAGADGRQCKELDRLMRHLESGPRPDVVNLANSLLAGIAPAVRERLDVPIVCSLQGEESFVDRLPADHRASALELIRRHARTIDLFVSPGRAYADQMAAFLDVEGERMRVVRAGVEVARFARRDPPAREPFRIGFLSRLCSAKGLDILCEAFRIVERRRPGGAALAVAGQARGPDAAFWSELQAQLAEAGLADSIECAGEVDAEQKVSFLHGCSVFCLPERFAEPRGIACLEAMAAGLPAVVPALGIFPEIIELTGGGVCVAPGDAGAFADALCRLRDDPAEVARLSRAAADGVARHFSVERLATETLSVYGELVSRSAAGP